MEIFLFRDIESNHLFFTTTTTSRPFIAMAKSMRSKVKRSFRSKKRETGVYAATEAARLHRLNSKLVATVTKDRDGDVLVEDADAEGDDKLGWSWLPVFGLLNHEDLTAESMESLVRCSLAQHRDNGDPEIYLGEPSQSQYSFRADRSILKDRNTC
jgi:hypothetical protein